MQLTYKKAFWVSRRYFELSNMVKRVCKVSNKKFLAQLAGAVEYTDCTGPGYDIKPSDGEVPVLEI